MSTTYSQRTIERAEDILDGVIQISDNEMLIHSQYVTPTIQSPELAEAGAVCGGRQACLLGSVALAYANTNDWATIARVLDYVRFGFDAGYHTFTRRWRTGLNRRPALKLAMLALNAEARERLAGKRSLAARQAQEWDSPAEGYFESYLVGLGPRATHNRIVELVEGARKRLSTIPR